MDATGPRRVGRGQGDILPRGAAGCQATSAATTDEGHPAVGDIANAYNESAGRHVSVEHWGDALEQGRIAGTVIAGGGARWGMVPGFWSTIGDKTMKYWHWGDGWDELAFEDRGDAF